MHNSNIKCDSWREKGSWFRLIFFVCLISTILSISCVTDNGSSNDNISVNEPYHKIENSDSSIPIEKDTSQLPKFKVGDIVNIPIRKNVGLYEDLPVYIEDKMLNDGSYKISDSNWCTLWFTQAKKFKVIEVVNIIKKQSDDSIIKYLMKMNKDYGELFWYRIQATDPAVGDKCIEGYIEEQRLTLSATN